MKKLGLVSMSCALAAMLGFSGCFGGGNSGETQNADHFEITIACQAEQSEQQVVEKLAAEYMKSHTDTKIVVKSFSGQDFETYMLGVSGNKAKSPNIIWTSDAYHSRWDDYFVDLRPYYEASAETDYSLYYESMLDTAGTNGSFKPTKSYTGSFRSNDKDTTDDRSEYGLYFAPRDYNKPTLLCNTKLFENLDKQYEEYFGAPAQTTTARLNEIVAGNSWDSIDDLFTFSKMIAERVDAIVAHASTLGVNGAEVSSDWGDAYALDLKLSWEPTYTTIFEALGVGKLINADGSLSLSQNAAALETLHNYLYPAGVQHLCCNIEDDMQFSQGNIFMKVVSRPIVVTYASAFKTMYGSTSLQSIQIPAEKIAAGCSGYAINRYYDDKSVTVGETTKGYTDICWDFIKYIITEDGQEVAGATGSNIPVLKSLHTADATWKKVQDLTEMNHAAWVAGGELKQDWYTVYQSDYRYAFSQKFANFFLNFIKSDYGYGKGSLADMIAQTESSYDYTGKTR